MIQFNKNKIAESKKMYENELSSMLKEHGADIIGFSDVSSILPEELSEYPYAVTIVRRDRKSVV